MKPLVQLLLAVGLLFVPTWVVAQPGRAKFSNSERRMAPVVLTWNVQLEKKEWRKSEEAAKVDVLLKAQQKLADWLRERYPYSTYAPAVDYIEKNIAKEGVLTELGEEVEGEKRYAAKVKLTLTPEVQRYLYHEVDRQLEQTITRETLNRQWLLSKGLLFILAVAAAAAGYFHLDDRFQGYYSKPLRLAAVIAVLLAGYGIAFLP